MKTHFLRFVSDDLTLESGQWVTPVVDIYNNDQFTNYSTYKTSYGLGGQLFTWAGLQRNSAPDATDFEYFTLPDLEAQGTWTDFDTDTAIVRSGRVIDLSAQVDIVSFTMNPENESTKLYLYSDTNADDTNYLTEWFEQGGTGVNEEIDAQDIERYIKFGFEVEGTPAGTFEALIRVEIHDPVVAPLFRFTRSMMRNFPQWMDMHHLPVEDATPTVAEPGTVGAQFVNAITGEGLDESYRQLYYYRNQTNINTVDLDQAFEAYRTVGIPDRVYSISADGIEPAVASTYEEFLLHPGEDIVYIDYNESTLYSAKEYTTLILNTEDATPQTYESSIYTIFNFLDDLGMKVDLFRIDGESNENFQKRILDVYKNRPGSGIEDFKLAIRRELDLWRTESATPDSDYVGATPTVLEMEDILEDPEYFTSKGLPTRKFMDLIDELSRRFPATWGRFVWGDALWDVAGEGGIGYDVVPYQYDATPVSSSQKQPGVGDGDDLFVYRPDADTGPEDYTATLKIKGLEKTLVDEYTGVELDFYAQPVGTYDVYDNPTTTTWFTVEATDNAATPNVYYATFEMSSTSDYSGDMATPATTDQSWAFQQIISEVEDVTSAGLEFKDMDTDVVYGFDATPSDPEGIIPLASITNIDIKQGKWDVDGQTYTNVEGSDIFQAWLSHASGTFLDSSGSPAQLTLDNATATNERPQLVLESKQVASPVATEWRGDRVEYSIVLNGVAPYTQAIAETIDFNEIHFDSGVIDQQIEVGFYANETSTNEAIGAWRAETREADNRSLTDLTGNERHMLMGGTAGSTPTASDPTLLEYTGERYMYLDGQTGNYSQVEDVNLLDSRQASFDNVAFAGTVNPEDRYEVWGTGGGTAEGSFTDASPMLIDLESYDVAAGLVLDGTSTTWASSASASEWMPIGDIEIVVKANAADWSLSGPPGQYMVLQYAPGDANMGFKVNSSGNLYVVFSQGATWAGAGMSATSDAAGLVDGTTYYLKTTIDTVAGSVVFYKSVDGTTWEQIGSPKTVNTGSRDASTATLTTGYGGEQFNGTIYEIQVRNGIGDDGVIVANPKFEGAHLSSGVTSFVDGQGNTWSLSGNAVIASGTPDQVGWLPGAAGNYFSIPDTNLLDTVQSTFHNTDFTGTINPEDSYEVWGTGGGTAAGSFTDASPMLIDLESYDVAAGLVLDGTSGNYASMPDSAALDITGDIDLRVDVALNDWTPSVNLPLVSKWGSVGSNQSFLLQIMSGGEVRMVWNDGAFSSESSTANPVVSDGGRLQVRATLDVDNGSGGCDVKFYTRAAGTDLDDDTGWTQLGSTVTGSVTSISATTTDVAMGFDGASSNLDGSIYAAVIKNGINGPTVANPKFEGAHLTGLPALSTFLDGQGNTWTLNGTASIASGTPSQVGWLPDVGGNYFNLSDVNLLPSNVAHPRDTTGHLPFWDTPLTWDTSEPLYFDGSIKCDAAAVFGDGHSAHGIITAIAEFVSVPSSQAGMVAGAWVKAPAGTSITVKGRYNSSGSYVISSGGKTYTATGSWEFMASLPHTAPVNSPLEAGVEVITTQSAVFHVGATIVRTDGVEAWTPSTKIVGDLDVRYRLYKDWDDADSAHLWDHYTADTGYLTNLTTDKKFSIQLGNGTATANYYSNVLSVTGRDELMIRSTVDTSTGDINHYTSTNGVTWTSAGTNTGAWPTAIAADTNSNIKFAGDVSMKGVPLYAEIRDGINGPIVASMDFTKMFEGNVTSDTSPEGHTATLNRTGVATAEIIDRDVWMFDTTSGLVVTDRDELDTDGDFEVVAGTYSQSKTSGQMVASKRGGNTSGDYGWWLYDSSSGSLSASFTTSSLDTSSGLAQEWVEDVGPEVIGARREGSDWTVYSSSQEDLTPAVVSGDPSNSIDLVIGRLGDNSFSYGGGVSWFAYFRRALTSPERTELSAWDGSIATEPTWLRRAAVFCINANDPFVKAYYNGVTSTNEVLNLAAKASNELGWVPMQGTDFIQPVSSTGTQLWPLVGSKMLYWRTGSGSIINSIITRPVGNVTAGQTYSASYSIGMNSGISTRDALPSLVWYDSEGGEVGKLSGAAQAGIPISYGGFTRHTVEGVAPAGATQVALEVFSNEANLLFYIDAVTLREGSDTGFIPSTRVVGDLDVRARVAMKDWSRSSEHSFILGKWSDATQKQYILTANVNGYMQLWLSTDGSTTLAQTASNALIPVSDRDSLWVRATREASTGDVTYYTSTNGTAWTQLGTVISGVTGSLYSGSSEVTLGSLNYATTWNPAGVFAFSEIRDGIDGPIVASMDLTKMFVGNVTSDTSPEGHIAALNRSGDATAEIVDRDTWIWGVDNESLSIPTRDILLPHEGDFEFALGIRTRSTVAPFIYHGSGASGERWISLLSGSQFRTLWEDTSANSVNILGSTGTNDGQKHVLNSVREGNVFTQHLDNDAGATVNDQSIGDIGTTTSEMIIGNTSNTGTYSYEGEIPWVAIFQRALTNTERTALAAWDGSIATEPSWLRPLAVFYINANDPWVKDYYDGTIETNSVLNLATAPYGELGWLTNNNSTGIARSNEVTPVVGSMVLKSTMDAVGLGAMNIASSPIGSVSAGQTYSASASLRQNSGATRTVGIILVWHDDEGGEIARETEVTQSVDTNTWVRVSASGVAPTGATQASIETTLISGNVCSLFVDAAVIRQGADTGYVPSLRIREDIDLRAAVALDDWTPDSIPETLIGKWGNNELAYRLQIDDVNGWPILKWSEDGSTVLNQTSGMAPTVNDGELLLVRVTMDVDNGSNQHELNYYTKTSTPSDANNDLNDDSGWSALGSIPVQAGTTSIFNSLDAVEIGANNSGGQNNLHGIVHSAVIKDGIGGPTVLDVDFTDTAQSTAPYTTVGTDTGQTVDLVGRATLVTSTRLYLDGVNDFLSIPHHDDFNVGPDDDLTVVAVLRNKDLSGAHGVVSKMATVVDGTIGWIAYTNGANILARVDDGTTRVQDPQGLTSSVVHTAGMVLDRSSDTVSSTVDGTGGTSSTSLVSSVENSQPVRIGSYSAGGGYFDGEIFGVAIFDRVLTPEEIEQVGSELKATGGSYVAVTYNDRGEEVQIPASLIYIDGNNEYESNKKLLPSGTTQIAMSTGTNEDYPVENANWEVFEATQTVPFSGVADVNGPWIDGKAPKPGNTNLNALVYDSLERSDFGVADTDSYIVQRMEVTSDNDRVVTMLESNVVSSAIQEDEITSNPPENAIVEKYDSNSATYYFEPFYLKSRAKRGPTKDWKPQIHTGFLHTRDENYYLFAKPETLTTSGTELELNELARQGAPLIVEDNDIQQRQVMFFDEETLAMTFTNTETITGDGSTILLATYDDLYNISVLDEDGASVSIASTTTADNEITTNAATIDGHEYEVSYKLRNSFYVDHDHLDVNDIPKSKVYFDQAPDVEYSVTYETSDLKATSFADIALNPAYTSQTEGFIFVSDNEYAYAGIDFYMSPSALLADGESYAVLTFYAYDEFGNPKAEQGIDVTTTYGTFDEATPTQSTNVVTDIDGFAYTVLYSEAIPATPVDPVPATGQITYTPV